MNVLKVRISVPALSCRGRGARGKTKNGIGSTITRPGDESVLQTQASTSSPYTEGAPFRTKETEIPTLVATATQPFVPLSSTIRRWPGPKTASQPSPHRSDAKLLILRQHSSPCTSFGFGASWPSSSRLSGASPGAEWLVPGRLVTGDNGRHSASKWVESVVQIYE
ncbi:hypothetical protein BDP81DRAFT_91387 [Colletotrichum phormii]|uniref:Uncharacterized protein n=1 Tax=Colletotrichum phormii TaxID=359342 RepID=A0AAJ0EK96_9PEZI|nr:uncharacterized protein BDP81DRAFT_91387 [Colletotrichum phormii]KAK1654946.1 hypothetical protein BDP81DRAFT_91387 [Colletotrichum phormii]